MIDPLDADALLEFLDGQDLVITIEACGRKKTFRESNCSKAVRATARGDELARLVLVRKIELARDILHDQGRLA